MPYDGGRPRAVSDVLDRTTTIARRAATRAGSAWTLLKPFIAPLAHRIGAPLGRLPLVKWFSASLKRRIVLSNAVGLVILLAGYLYLNQYKDWLVDAKLDSLTAQGEIIAQAIAANATLDGNRLAIDPEALPEDGFSAQAFRDDGFASLSFSIGPERVTPILRRLVQPDIRARVYDRDGRLIVDSEDFPSGRKLVEPRPEAASPERPRTKNFWTRMTAYLFVPDLPVLREIDRANGHYYPPVRSAMAGTGTPMLLLNEDSQQIVSYAAPIVRAKQIHGVLLLSTDPGEIEKVLNKERNAIWKLAILAILTSIVVSLLLAYAVADPIHKLSEAARAVSHDINAHKQLPDYPNRSDEVAQLAASFRAMTEALYRRIEASEKFAADVAHELKNPLTAASSTAQSLYYARTDEEREQLVGQIRAELKRLNKLISDVSNASRLDAELALQQREPVSVRDVVESVVASFRDIISDTGRTVALTPIRDRVSDLMVLGQDGRLGQVVTNLIDNAVSFSPDDGEVTVTCARMADEVEIAVEDQGPGIDPEKLETVFERFYTYRPTASASRGNNSGLGLSISREIVKAHGGRIWAENRYRGDPGAAGGLPSNRLGARFVVRLPAERVVTTGRPSAHRPRQV